MRKGLKYRRIVLKLSGEALAGASGECIDKGVMERIAGELGAVRRRGVQLGIVIGGGNIVRGRAFSGGMTDRPHADDMGMLATVINSLALRAFLERAGIDAVVLSATPMEKIADFYTPDLAVHHLRNGRVVIMGGGTGNPFFTTDTAAALRCAETGAEALLKATKVDGVYDADPLKNPGAKKFRRIGYDEALRRNLGVMDATAFSFCKEHSIPIIVFKLFQRGALLKILEGKPVGSIVTKGE
jgi:uridylate kinase